VYLPAERDINAYTDGSKILLTQGMLDFVSDDELSVVIGHELAHDVMHHMTKQKINTLMIEIAGGFVDGFINVGMTEKMLTAYTALWSPEFEKEADYVGLYLLARADGRIGAAAPFWRRMAAEHGMDSVLPPDFIFHTHPPAPERFAVLREAEAEIIAKAKAHKPLMPEMDGNWNFGSRYAWWSDTSEDDDEPEDADLNH
jgi:Zn-dependent protease with chaperone function